MKPEKLEPMFKKALQTCKFFPKIADILENANDSQEKLAELEAECAWSEVLELRTRYWSPDAPGGFWRGMPPLSAQVKQACRAAGVFKDYESTDQLHVWAHKRFIESYLAWGTLEKEKHLLPDGPIKNLLTDAAQAKALPASDVDFAGLHERGRRYAEQINTQTKMTPLPEPARPVSLWGSKEEREEAYAAMKEKETDPRMIEEIRRQKAAVFAKYQKPVEDGGARA
jgi:hypothetical protein